MVADTGLVNAFAPLPPSEPVLFVEMPTADLVVAGGLMLLPVACLLCLGLGLMGLRASVPEVRGRLTWRLGRFVLGPLRLIGLLLLLAVIAVAVSVALYAVAYLSGGAVPTWDLFIEAGFEALLIAVGWCLMVFPAKALGLWTTRTEGKAVVAATLVISIAALLEAGVWFIAAAVGAAMLAADPSADVPPTYPWADGFTALAAVVGLLVVAWVARRIVHRMKRSSAQAAPLPA